MKLATAAKLVGALVLAACTPRPLQLVHEEAQAMGTSVQLMAYTRDPEAAARAFTGALKELHRIEELMTTWEHPGWPRSDIMRLNDSAGEMPVSISADTLAVLQASQAMAHASGGKFDVTFGAMGGLWKFDEDMTGQLPTPQAIAARLALVDYRDLKVQASPAKAQLLRPGMRVNLGGIAKGYGVDACARVLRQRGLKDFLVQAGGDLYVSGSKGDVPWKVGIRDPRALGTDEGIAGESYFATAELRDVAFSTAGDYERSFVRLGRRYHHILDPATGEPATACRSVTLFAPTALLADGLDDTVFILGPKKGLQLLKSRYPECGAVIVDAANKVWISENLREVVTVLHPPSDGP